MAAVVLILVALAEAAAADTASSRPLLLSALGRSMPWYHLPLTIASAAVIVLSVGLIAACFIAMLIRLAAMSSEWSAKNLMPHRKAAFGLAGVLGLLIGGHWVLGSYFEWKRRAQDSSFGFARALLSFQIADAARSLLTALLFALPILLFFALLALLRESRPPDRHERAFIGERAWVGPAIALIFSAYVVGRGGWIDQLSLPLPVAFLTALSALWLLTRRRPTSVDRSRLVGVGPKLGWWENGVVAAKLSLPLAVVPFVFFSYTLLDARLGPAFGLHSSFEWPFLLTWIANEAIFWVAAAFTLGWLLVYLPGSNAVLKGLSLAAVYAGSVALGVLLVGRSDEHWLFRAFILVLFYIGLGIRIDFASLRRARMGWREFIAEYNLGTVRGAAAYAAPALLALIGIIQQLYAGNPQQAGHDLLQNLTSFIPNVGNH
jgi:hypothetical protein